MSEDWRWTSRPPEPLLEVPMPGVRPIPPAMRPLAEATAWLVGDRVIHVNRPSQPGTVIAVQDGTGSFGGVQVVAWHDDEDRQHISLGSDIDAAPDAAVGASPEVNRA